MRRNNLLLLALISMCGLLSACRSEVQVKQPITLLPEDEKCIDSFDTFAFSTPDLGGTEQEFIPPANPWVIESTVPGTILIRKGEVSAIRKINNYQEVWIRSGPSSFLDSADGKPSEFWIYRTDTKTWSEAPTWLDKSNGLFVDKVFVSVDGTVWGKNMWIGKDPKTKPPALSRYNGTTNQFEFVAETADILNETNISSLDWYYSSPVQIDAKGLVWLFVYKDAIYSFDPILQAVTRHSSMEEYEQIYSLSLSPDGIFYFYSSYGLYTYETIDYQLFEYSPQKEEIKPLPIPKESWPAFKKILADHLGNLWLDAFGWRDANGQWVKFYPAMKEYMLKNRLFEIYRDYTPPEIFLESSDGRLWFRNRPKYRTGIAWYDPVTKQGCWFTSIDTNLSEDTEHKLWMFYEDTMYMRPITP